MRGAARPRRTLRATAAATAAVLWLAGPLAGGSTAAIGTAPGETAPPARTTAAPPLVRTSTGTIGPETPDRIAITALQLLLLRLGWIVPLDGVWSTALTVAVEQFQEVNGLDVTGVLDDSTRVALGSPDALGAAAVEFLDLPPSLASDPLQRIEEIADRTGFDWRGVGGTYVFGCPPSDLSGCTLGAYVPATRTMYVSRGAFTTDVLLEYIVFHEQAHLWQFTSCPPPLRAGCLAPFGLSGIEALQAGADCLATHWGARFRGYYRCPPDAVPVVGELYESTVAG